MTRVTSIAYKYDPNYHRFADYLGLDAHERKDFELAKKVSLLYDWAKETSKSEEFEKLIDVVDVARKDAGVTFTGKTLITFLHQRVRLKMDSDKSKLPEAKPTRKYEERLSERDRTIDRVTEATREKQELAEKANVKYISRYKKSIPKQKQEKLEPVDYSKPTSPEPV